MARPFTLALLSLAAFANTVSPKPPVKPGNPPRVAAAEAPPLKVGRVIIVGNEITKDRVIREVVDLHPGQVLRFPQLRLAERNLKRLGLFKVDDAQGLRPTVTVLDGDGEFRDILVQVAETQTCSLRVEPVITKEGQLAVRLVAEEKNFDPWRWPVSAADIVEGKAFRGGGVNLRLELLRIPLTPCVAPGCDFVNKYLQARLGCRLDLSNLSLDPMITSAFDRLGDPLDQLLNAFESVRSLKVEKQKQRRDP